MAVSTEELEEQQDELEPEAAGEQTEETSGEALEDQSAQLAKQESATAASLDNLQRQLSRMESRLDRGGSDAASIRQLRSEINQVSQRLDGIGELRELVDGLLEANVPPEKLAALKVRQAETRASRAEARAKQVEEESTNRVNLQPAAARQTEAEQAALAEAASILEKRMQRAGYDPNDTAVTSRLIALVPGIQSMGVSQRLNALTDALQDMKDADEASGAQAGRRKDARTAVRTDRPAASGASSGSGNYASYEDLCAAHMNGDIDTATVQSVKAKKGW